MSVIYLMDRESAEVIELLKAGKIPNCKHVHRPLDDEGKPSGWPDGIEFDNGRPGQKTVGWFEADMVLFWGAQNYILLLQAMRTAGIHTTYIG